MASAYSTENHQYAYRVRNMLNAAGIEAEVRPHYQIVGGMKEWLVEAPWYVMVPETAAGASQGPGRALARPLRGIARFSRRASARPLGALACGGRRPPRSSAAT